MSVPWQAKFAALALIWGSSFLLMKFGLEAFSPVQIATFRIVSGAAAVTLTALVAGVRLPRSGRVWAHLSVSAVALASVPFTLFPLGEERVSSALAGIGNATTPIATVLFGLLLLPVDRFPRSTLVAVAVGFAGVVVIAQPWSGEGGPDLLGFGLTLVAGASYGFGWTYLKRFLGPGDAGGLALPAAQLIVASAQMVLVLLGWWLLHRNPTPGIPEGLPAPWSPHAEAGWGPLAAVLVLGIVGTGLAYALQFDVVRAAGPTVGATVTYVIPVVAVALGIVVLHEQLAWPQVLGAAIVLAAAVVIGRPRRAGTAAPVRRSAPTGSSTGRS